MVLPKELWYRSREEIMAYQEEKLRETVKYVFEKSPFYHRLFHENGLTADDIMTIDDLRKLPVTTKKDLQLHNMEFLCVPKSEIVDYVTTSGTLGDPVIFAETRNDLDRLGHCEAQSFALMNTRPGDKLQLICTLDRRFMAGMACFLGGGKSSMGVIRTGNGIPELQWDTILKMEPDVCSCVPSFLIKMMDYAQKNGIDYHNCSLKKALCLGESIRNNDFSFNALGQQIHDRWPELQLFSNYASTEMQSSFNECEKGCGTHHKPELTIVEFLDENNERVADDQSGEVTITTLGVTGMPLLRFKTGDMCYHTYEKCSCGRNSMRLSPIIGRKGQMVKYKGTTLYPSALYDVLDNIPGVQNYIVQAYTNEIGTDGLLVRVGSTDRSEQFIKCVKDAFRSKIRVAPDVSIEPAEVIAKLIMPPMSRKVIKFLDLRG